MTLQFERANVSSPVQLSAIFRSDPQMAEAEGNPWQQAEDGWKELVAAAAKIQSAANAIKSGPRSIDGYNIERSLNKHKPHLMQEHYDGLKAHRQEHKL
jgi:hypothetical protein